MQPGAGQSNSMNNTGCKFTPVFKDGIFIPIHVPEANALTYLEDKSL